MGAAPQHDDDEIISAINITPMVDIMLVLLIIFMVTASLIVSKTIDLELPTAANADEAKATMVALNLTRDGKLYINERLATMEEIIGLVGELKAEGDDPTMVIAADQEVPYGKVAALLDLVKGLLTEKGLSINMGAAIRGASGVEYPFNIVFSDPSDPVNLFGLNLVIGDDVFSQVFELSARKMDVNARIVLASIKPFPEEVISLGQLYGITLIQSDTAADLVEKLLESS